MENGKSSLQNRSVVQKGESPMDAAYRLREDAGSGLPTTGHKRTLSGSILSKLFLRPVTDLRGSNLNDSPTDGASDGTESIRASGSSMSNIIQQKKTRKRKGSLRKTALLGTGKLKLEGRERKGSGLDTVEVPVGDGNSDSNSIDEPFSPTSPDSTDDLPTPRPSYEKRAFFPASKASPNIGGLGVDEYNRSEESLPLPGLTRKPTLGDMSTTDEDDVLTFSRNLHVSPVTPLLKKPSSSVADSYFPPNSVSLQRRRSSNKVKSPLATLPVEATVIAEDWNYSDTEWWGWVVLIVTWVVFVVGMGSCFEVWSWAWDVGETPYAPPELEDDPTLPIVGYYPALIILTAIMAWVWVVVAWVGMKYFKHAKIPGEDM